MKLRSWAVGAVLGSWLAVVGQECRAPLPPRLESAENMFSAQQESWLGEAIADAEEARWRVIHDAALNAYVQHISDRLLAGVDTHGIQIKLKLVESAEVNGWTIADGRVYLTRKMLIAAHNEDEIAGVMAHEFGHALTGQIPIDISRRFRDTLHITSVGDRKNVFDTYNRFVENARRQKIDIGKFERLERDEQTVADQMAIALLARAGYGPHSFADFWDRISEAQGKTGNAFTDFFGATKPEGKRLRLIQQMAAGLSPECRHETKAASAEFHNFQNAAIQFKFDSAERAALTEGAANDTGIHALDPPLRAEVFYVRFSPDGKYLLAQDEASVFVMSRQPFALLAQIEAPDAYKATFTPDSKQVVVSNRALRIEKWDYAQKKMTEVHEVVRPKECLQAVVSPDGTSYACATLHNFEFGVELRDTLTGQLVAQRKNLRQLSGFDLLLAALAAGEHKELPLLNMAFSPNGRYLLAAKFGDAFAFDTSARQEVKLGGAVRDVAGVRFDWVGNDHIVGVDFNNTKKSGLVQFPSGVRVTQSEFSSESVAGATKGDYALLGPTKQFATVVFDLKQGKIIAAHNREGLDVYDGAVASDRITGDVQLQEKDGQPQALMLPVSPLHKIEAAAVSADLRYLAVSLKRSAGVYDLTTGKRVMHIRPFAGATFDKEELVGDFPKISRKSDATHDVARLAMNGAAVKQEKIDDATTSVNINGRLMFKWTHAEKHPEDRTLTVTDAASGATLWTREYAKSQAPEFSLDRDSENVVMVTTAEWAKDEIRSDPKLSQQLAALTKKSDKRQIYYLEVLEGKTGKRLGHLLCDTGQISYLISSARATGDTMIVTDSRNRLLLYSLKDGTESAHFVGQYLSHSPRTSMIAMKKGMSDVHLIDATTGQDVFQRQFAAPVALVAFNDEGTRMLVLTDDQKYRVLKVTVKRSGQEVASK